MPGAVGSRMKPLLGPGPAARLRESAEKAAAAGEPDREALEVLRAGGLLATAVPRAHGGAGGDGSDVNRVVADIAAVNPSAAIIAFQHFAVSARITEWGSEEQKRRLLPRLADGSVLAASSWSETGAGAAKQNLASTGTRRPDGTWVLDGAKAFTTGAAVADLYLVLVKTAGAAAGGRGAYGAAGQTFFLVDADNPGLVPDLRLELAGMRGSATGFVALDGCVVSDEDRLGPEGHAAAIIAGVRETGATLGAVSAGIARAAFDLALSHAHTRGLLDLATVRHRLVALATRVEAVQAAVDRAGARPAPAPGLATLHSKLYATTAAEEICLDVARMLGSAGYGAGSAADRLLADARAVGLMGPTNDVCRELVALSWTA